MLSARQAALRASRSLTARATVGRPALARNALRPLSTSPSQNRSAPSPNQTLRDVVVQTVKNIGSHREGQQYLKYFTSVSSDSFAIIKAGGAILTDHLDNFCQSLLVLHQLGLYPVVVHGAGPQLNKLLEEAGVEPQFQEGIRVTDSKTLSIATKLFYQESLRLSEALNSVGVTNMPITHSLTADYLDRERWGFVGDITHVNVAPIEKAIKAGYIPIVPSLAMTEEGQVLNVNADVTAANLARAMKPLKIIYLSEKGGLYRGEGGEMISEIFLDQEYDEIMAQPWCQRGTGLKIRESKKLLDTLPRTSSIAIIHPDDLQTELFTISGAGTLIRRGEKVEVASSLSEIKDLNKFKDALARGQLGDESARVTIDNYVEQLKDRPFKAYFDDAMGCLAIVLQPTEKRPYSSWVTLSVTKSAWLTNSAENVFQTIEKENSDLVWTVSKYDENLSWFFDRCDGSFCVDDVVLFWRGFRLEKYGNLQPILEEVQSLGRISLGEPPEEAPAATSSSPTKRSPTAQQTRAFSTSTRPGMRQFQSTCGRPRTYVTRTNPNPPLGKKNITKDKPARVALIGARGYTGQALIDLINTHEFLDLTHVSSRELAGQKLKGYDKREVVYENLSPEDVRDLEKNGEVDCWVMALPNGVCKPFVEAVYEGRKGGASESVIVDLSADYRFDKNWTYGLPELTRRADLQQSHQISNPGCYATAAQLGIAPLVDHLGGEPTVFGVSGYSGAGTKPSPKNDVELLRNNMMPYSLTDHIHEREIGNQLGIQVSFMPHVASWFQGIQHTINIPLNKTMTSRDVRQIYQDRYAGEKLVKVIGEPPQVRQIMGRHGVEIGGFAVHSGGKRVVVCATIDNLLKGAATQCLQNMNLALGFAEYEGIPTM
ncbi:hypothetical protein VUR80DRAFT_8481 [Thermomyces stellatus]